IILFTYHSNHSIIFLVVIIDCLFLIFFFSSRRRHTRSYGDWSSDVCSSDLVRRRCHCPGSTAPHRLLPPRPSRHWSRRGSAPGPKDCGSFGRRCFPWTSPWRTRPCSSCRSARHPLASVG